MTKEEAIEFGKMWLEVFETDKDSHTYEFFDMAIEALEQERSRLAQITQYRNDCEKLMQENEQLKKALKQEPCEDCISRQAVLDLVVANHTELNGVNVVMYSPLCKDIKQLPSVRPQEPILDKIEPKCDRINSLASVLPYTAHREIQELLCEIMDLCKESEGDEE